MVVVVTVVAMIMMLARGDILIGYVEYVRSFRKLMRRNKKFSRSRWIFKRREIDMFIGVEMAK